MYDIYENFTVSIVQRLSSSNSSNSQNCGYLVGIKSPFCSKNTHQMAKIQDRINGHGGIEFMGAYSCRSHSTLNFSPIGNTISRAYWS